MRRIAFSLRAPIIAALLCLLVCDPTLADEIGNDVLLGAKAALRSIGYPINTGASGLDTSAVLAIRRFEFLYKLPIGDLAADIATPAFAQALNLRSSAMVPPIKQNALVTRNVGLAVLRNGGRRTLTGFLIGPCEVVTNAHALVAPNGDTGPWSSDQPPSGTFYMDPVASPAVQAKQLMESTDSDVESGFAWHSTFRFVAWGYLLKGDTEHYRQNDWALLKLDSCRSGDSTLRIASIGKVMMQGAISSSITGAYFGENSTFVEITGFPADGPVDRPTTFRCSLSDYRRGRYFSPACPTVPGTSGSPVVVEFDKPPEPNLPAGPLVIGINSFSSNDQAAWFIGTWAVSAAVLRIGNAQGLNETDRNTLRAYLGELGYDHLVAERGIDVAARQFQIDHLREKWFSAAEYIVATPDGELADQIADAAGHRLLTPEMLDGRWCFTAEWHEGLRLTLKASDGEHITYSIEHAKNVDDGRWEKTHSGSGPLITAGRTFFLNDGTWDYMFFAPARDELVLRNREWLEQRISFMSNATFRRCAF